MLDHAINGILQDENEFDPGCHAKDAPRCDGTVQQVTAGGIKGDEIGIGL